MVEKIHRVEEKIMVIESAMCKCTTNYKDIPAHGSTDKISMAVIKKIKLEQELSELMEIEMRCQFELAEYIKARITNQYIREIMTRRYAMLESYGEIAKEMSMNRKKVYYLHSVGIKQLTN